MLITTDAASEGMDLANVEECINYDLPLTPSACEQRWGRFLWLGRKAEFRMIILRDQSRALRWEEEILSRLQPTVSPR
jgi:superfamily II DNA/RNA helicase